MKKIISVLLVVLMLTACGKTNNDSTNKTGCTTLNVYNWGSYIGENVNSEFEEKFGVKVNYSLYDSNEALYTKIASGSKFDVIFPSDYTVERLAKDNLLAKLDKNIITNFKNLHEDTLNKEFDPENEYSIPYMWGDMGIIYDSTIVDSKDVESQGWSVLKNEKYANQIYMYDSERDAFMVAFKSLGYSMNTENEDEINAAYEWLADLHEKMNPSYVTDEAIDGLTYGQKVMSYMYSSYAAAIMSENENMRYFVPKEGTNVWIDAMAIPAASECQELANEYINFMLEYETAMANSKEVGYTSSNKEVFEELASTDYKGINSFVPVSGRDTDEVFKHNDALREKLSELWIKVKNQGSK